MDKNKALKILSMISKDVEQDAKNFEGKPFTGKNVAEYFGNHGAAIVALSKVIGSLNLKGV